MTVHRSGSQVKYELLEENSRITVDTRHVWSAVLLVILVICSSVIAIYLTWQHMLNSSKAKENLDFLMIGPKKLSPGYEQSSQQRGEIYSQAIQKMQEIENISLPLLDNLGTPQSEPLQYKRVCYYTLAPNNAHLPPDLIDPDLCTHINIAFATVSNGTITPIFPSDLQTYAVITGLKQKYPDLKVMLSVEWFSSTGEFAWVVATPQNRTRFVNQAVEFLQSNLMDGLDIDWEFPSWPTVVYNQTSCFMELLRLLSETFHSQEHPLLLSVAVGAPKPIIDQSYNITVMAGYVDFVNVMAYDYHMYQSYTPLTGANAPLYQRRTEKGYFSTLNTNWTAHYWLYKGMPHEKIIIGIPTYGHSFTLVNEHNHGWEAPSSGFGTIGVDGFVGYQDVCTFMSQSGVQSDFDFENKVPYAYKKKEWISFDNEQSVAYKAEFTKENRFGGVMIFSLNTDDGTATCDGKTRFPLTLRIKNVLQDDQL